MSSARFNPCKSETRTTADHQSAVPGPTSERTTSMPSERFGSRSCRSSISIVGLTPTRVSPRRSKRPRGGSDRNARRGPSGQFLHRHSEHDSIGRCWHDRMNYHAMARACKAGCSLASVTILVSWARVLDVRIALAGDINLSRIPSQEGLSP